MDGYGYVMVALGLFILGGILNIAFLMIRYCYGERFYDFDHDSLEGVAKWSVRTAWTLLALQLCLILLRLSVG
jgi:hypothetical protein